jgi:hypothetical protein
MRTDSVALRPISCLTTSIAHNNAVVGASPSRAKKVAGSTIRSCIGRMRFCMSGMIAEFAHVCLGPNGVRLLGISCQGALETIAEALAASEGSGARWWEAEIHRLKGLVLLSARGERSVLRALSKIAQQQNARSLLDVKEAKALLDELR